MSAFREVGTITLGGKSYYLELRIEGVNGFEHAKIHQAALGVFKAIAETQLEALRSDKGVSLAWNDFQTRAGIQEPRATVTEVDDDEEELATPATNVSSGEKPKQRVPEPVSSARASRPMRTPAEQAARWKHFRDEIYKPIIRGEYSLANAIDAASEDDKRVLKQVDAAYQEYALAESQKNKEIFASRKGQPKRVISLAEWLKDYIAERDKQLTAFSASALFAKFKGLIS